MGDLPGGSPDVTLMLTLCTTFSGEGGQGLQKPDDRACVPVAEDGAKRGAAGQTSR